MSTEVAKNADGSKKKLTSDDVVEIAKKITNDDSVQVLDYNLKDYSEDKLGFTASHHALKITVQKSNAGTRDTLNAFIKIVNLPMPDNYDKKVDINGMICDKETFFLKDLISQFTDSYKGERWWPKHYYSTRNIVAMEDLKSDGYKLIERFFDDYAVLQSVLASLARFHSCSILAEARNSQLSKGPIALNEQYKDAFQEQMYVRNGDMKAWLDTVTKFTGDLAEYLGYDSATIHKLFDILCDIVLPSKIYRSVVCHGDVHSKNTMFTDGSPLPKCILVDFQTYRYAPLVTDILQFLHINASRKFREQHEVKLLEFYHSVLTDSIKNNDSTGIANIPTLEEILKGMEDLRTFGLVMACIYHPILFVDPDLMKKHARDEEFNKNLLLGDRLEFTLSHMKDNELFKNKIEEALRELIERSA